MKTADPHFDAAGHFIGASYCPCSARDFARFGLLFLRDGVWDGRRILPEGWVDYSRTPSPQSDGLYGAHFWVTPGSLGIFSCQGAWGQRILIVPKLDLVVVRLGQTAPHKVGAVVQYCKELVDAFRPTARACPPALRWELGACRTPPRHSRPTASSTSPTRARRSGRWCWRGSAPTWSRSSRPEGCDARRASPLGARPAGASREPALPRFRARQAQRRRSTSTRPRGRDELPRAGRERRLRDRERGRRRHGRARARLRGACARRVPIWCMSRSAPSVRTGPTRTTSPRTSRSRRWAARWRCMGEPDRRPVRITVPQTWHHAAVEGALAALVAHQRRLETGAAQLVDVSVQAAVFWTGLNAMIAHAIHGPEHRAQRHLAAAQHAGHSARLPVRRRRGDADRDHRHAARPDPVDARDGRRSTRPGSPGRTGAPTRRACSPAASCTLPLPAVRERIEAFTRKHVQGRPLRGRHRARRHARAGEHRLGRARPRAPARRATSGARCSSATAACCAPRAPSRASRARRSTSRGPLPISVSTRPRCWARCGRGRARRDPGRRIRPRRCGSPSRASSSPTSPGSASARSPRRCSPTTAPPWSTSRPTSPPIACGWSVPFKDDVAGHQPLSVLRRLQHLEALAPARPQAPRRPRHREAPARVGRRLPRLVHRGHDGRALGLGYEVARELNPGLIMASTCLMGQTGPAAKLAGYGYHAASVCGFYEVTGWDDRPPGGPFNAYTDTIAPRFLATALIAALDHRRRTGEGQLHRPGADGVVAALPRARAARGADHGQERAPRRQRLARSPLRTTSTPVSATTSGARSRSRPTRSGARCAARSATPSGRAPRALDTLAGRLAQRERIDRELAAFTARHARARADGPAAGRRRPGGHGAALERSPGGPAARAPPLLPPARAPRDGPRARTRATPTGSPATTTVPALPAPCLGEHTYQVLAEVLGLDDEEIARVMASGACG